MKAFLSESNWGTDRQYTVKVGGGNTGVGCWSIALLGLGYSPKYQVPLGYLSN